MPGSISSGCVACAVAGLLLMSAAADTARAEPAKTEAPVPTPVDMQKRMELYRKKLADYTKAWNTYEKVAAPYWNSVTEKRRARRAKRARGATITADDYELRQPPVYGGPPKPKNPEEEKKPPPRKIPIVEDFLANAKEHFGFKPQAPETEVAFKQAYAKVASAAGLTKEAAVKIYGFESGGDGKYDVLEIETRFLKGPRGYDTSGLPFHRDNQTVIKERFYPDKASRDVMHLDITTIDNALTRPWTVTKKFRRERNPTWFENDCSEDNHHVAIGQEHYFLSADGHLMPAKKGQAPPDLKYFKQSLK